MGERARRGDVDDRRGADVVLRGQGLRGEDRPQQVRAHLALELLLGDARQRREGGHPRVVHEHVDRSELLARTVEQAAHVVTAGHVRPDRQRPAALRGDCRDDPLGPLLVLPVVHHDGRARPGQRLGDPRPDALRRARDDRRTCLAARAHSDSSNVGTCEVTVGKLITTGKYVLFCKLVP